jgi:uncharacterized protein (DUF697 family)
MDQQAALPSATPKRVLAGEFDRASAEDREKAIREVILRASSVASTITWQPLPFLDSAVFTVMQRRMLQSLARLHGYRAERKDVVKTFGVLGRRMVLPNVFIAAGKLLLFVPILPDLLAGTIAESLTATLGEVGDRYYRSGRKLSADELRKTFDALYRDTLKQVRRGKLDQIHVVFTSRAARKELRKLRRASRGDKMSYEEEAEKREEIVDRYLAQRDQKKER